MTARPMTEGERVKPCPFCGDVLTLITEPIGDDWLKTQTYWAHTNHRQYDCWLSDATISNAPEEIAAWNRRLPAAAVRGMREAWRSDIENAPRDGTPFLAMWPHTVRWKAYRPSGARAMGVAGRWQKSNGYGGWDNCDEPHSFSLAALSLIEGEDEQATRADDGPTAPTDRL